jgi:hypothetical protein
MDPLRKLRAEILTSTQRILTRLNEIDSESQVPEELTQQCQDVLGTFSALQTAKSAALLEDVTKWSETRKHSYSHFEAPLLRQVEDNQSITHTATDEAIPKLQSQMDHFHERLTVARSQLVSIRESVLRAGQGLSQGAQQGEALSQLQLESPPFVELAEPSGPRPEDEELIKPMKLREEHFILVVRSLRAELDKLSAEMNELKIENSTLTAQKAALETKVAALLVKAPLCVSDGVSAAAVKQVRLLAGKSVEFEAMQLESKRDVAVEVGGESVARPWSVELSSLDIPPSISGGIRRVVRASASRDERACSRVGAPPGQAGAALALVLQTQTVQDALLATSEVVFEFMCDESGQIRVVSQFGGRWAPGTRGLAPDIRALLGIGEDADLADGPPADRDSAQGGGARQKGGGQGGAEQRGDRQQGDEQGGGGQLAGDVKVGAFDGGASAGDRGGSSVPADGAQFAGDGRSAPLKGARPRGRRVHGAGAIADPEEVSDEEEEEEFEPTGLDAVATGRPGRRAPWATAVAADSAADASTPEGEGAGDGLATFLAVKHEPDNGALRFFFKDRDDAIIVDTPVDHQPSNQTYVVQGSNVAVRIRNGFNPKLIDRWKREEELHLSLQPVRLSVQTSADGGPAKSGVNRGMELKRTLIRLFETTHKGDVSLCTESPEPDLAFRWKGFPVRPPPPRARLYLSPTPQRRNVPLHAVHSARAQLPKLVYAPRQKPIRASDVPPRLVMEPRIIDIGAGLKLPPHRDVHRM